jgi:hypothetical protein
MEVAELAEIVRVVYPPVAQRSLAIKSTLTGHLRKLAILVPEGKVRVTVNLESPKFPVFLM